MPETLIDLPLPALTFLASLVAAGVVWRIDPGVRLARVLFAAFFGLGALLSLGVALRFGYGVDLLVPLQRTLPLWAGPTLYAGFRVLSLPAGRRLPVLALHLAALPLAAIGVILATRPEFSDLAILLSYLGYGIALVLLWRRGPDALTAARIGMAPDLCRWMLRGAGLLFAFLVMDTAIALSFAMGRTAAALGIISLGALTTIVLLVGLILSLSRADRPAASAPRAVPTDDLVARADALLTEKQLYLDTDLTVDRLARRLGVPARSLSEAVNRAEGQNVSQFVNRYRLRHAETLLVQTDQPATTIAEASGFLTRSNFYREFQRVNGMSPAAWRQGRR